MMSLPQSGVERFQRRKPAHRPSSEQGPPSAGFVVSGDANPFEDKSS